jgi:hypothetical protein
MSATGPDTDPVIERLEEQISWYDRKAVLNQRLYSNIKTTEIVAAALIPFVGAINFPGAVWVTGGLGVLITIFEGLLHLNQYEQNWLAYRSTCETLRHEKFRFLAGAAHYAGVANPRALLAERVESVVAQEQSNWASTRQEPAQMSAATS